MLLSPMSPTPTVSKIIPPRLERGSTIALISPSARIHELIPHRMSQADTFLRSLGYKVLTIYTPISPDSTLKQRILHRCAEIHDAFANCAVSAVVCTIGGSTANELLPHLDYALIKAHPKIFCGFSDITLLHYALYKYADLRTFYGPTSITQWAEYPSPLRFTVDHFTTALTQTGPLGQLPCSKEWTDDSPDWFTKLDFTRARQLRQNPGWRWLRPGKAEGIIFGGCLPSVLKMVGTQYDLPSYRNVILLVELPEGEKRKAKPLTDAQSMLCDLANRGIFEEVAGLVLGRSYGFDEEMTRQWEEYALQISEGKQFPVLAGVDIGHTDPMITIPLGARVELDSEKGVWSILESGVA